MANIPREGESETELCAEYRGLYRFTHIGVIRQGGSPSHGIAAFLCPTYTTDEEAMQWGDSPSHGIAALPLSTYTSTGVGGWVIRSAH